jgi:hypothetical protein
VKALWIILGIVFPLLGIWVHLLVRVLVDERLPRAT